MPAWVAVSVLQLVLYKARCPITRLSTAFDSRGFSARIQSSNAINALRHKRALTYMFPMWVSSVEGQLVS